MRYDNQKVIKPDTTTTRAEKPYLLMPFKALDDAAVNLNGNAFKLWIYFARNVVDWNYSTTDIANRTGISVEGVRNSFNELVEKGYLNTNNNLDYQFHIYAAKAQVQPQEELHPFYDERTGTDYGMINQNKFIYYLSTLYQNKPTYERIMIEVEHWRNNEYGKDA